MRSFPYLEDEDDTEDEDAVVALSVPELARLLLPLKLGIQLSLRPLDHRCSFRVSVMEFLDKPEAEDTGGR